MKYQIEDLNINMKQIYDNLKTLGCKAFTNIDDLTPLSNRWLVDNGLKLAGRELMLYLDKSTMTIDDAGLMNIAKSIYYRYGVKWNKDYDAFMAEYNPISNYDRKQKQTRTVVNNETVNNTDEGTETNTNNGTQTINLSAFDNDVLKKDSETINADTGNLQRNNTSNTVKDNNMTETFIDDITGNIGVTTSQQMIESEFVLREKHRLMDIISNDIREALTLKIYNFEEGCCNRYYY